MTPLETAAMHLQTAIAEIQPRDGLEPWLLGWMISHALADFCAEAGIDDIRGELAGLSDRLWRVIDPRRKRSRGSQGGTHRSPISHLRCGNLRRLPTGKTIRVKECLIGVQDAFVDRRIGYHLKTVIEGAE